MSGGARIQAVIVIQTQDVQAGRNYVKDSLFKKHYVIKLLS